MCCTKSQGRRRFSSAEREAEFKQDIVACQEECSIYCGMRIARADRFLGLETALISYRNSTGTGGSPSGSIDWFGSKHSLAGSCRVLPWDAKSAGHGLGTSRSHATFQLSAAALQ